MKIKLTVLVFFISMLLTGQVLAFDVGGLSYSVIPGTTNVEVRGRAVGNSDTDIVIPASVLSPFSLTQYSVTTIENIAFNSNDLTSVTIGNSVTTIGEAAFAGNALTSVIVPDSVTTIGDYSFGNNALTSVTIGNSVTSIGYAAFNGNALTSVIVPDSVTTIGDYAFSNNALTSVAFEGNFGTFSLDMFEPNFDLATITYCEETTDWPQGFNTGATIVVTTPIVCLPPGC